MRGGSGSGTRREAIGDGRLNLGPGTIRAIREGSLRVAGNRVELNLVVPAVRLICPPVPGPALKVGHVEVVRDYSGSWGATFVKNALQGAVPSPWSADDLGLGWFADHQVQGASGVKEEPTSLPNPCK